MEFNNFGQQYMSEEQCFLSGLSLSPAVKEYAWGKQIEQSPLAINYGIRSETGRCAETWFGAHPQGPAGIVGDSTNLLDTLAAHPEILGDRVLEKYRTFPFLFKTLFVGEALSIQAHPDSTRAIKLHESQPKIYKDPFPKPEVGLAKSQVKILYGFKELNEVLDTIKQIPELGAIMGHLRRSDLNLKTLYEKLVYADGISEQSVKLYDRLAQAKESGVQLSAAEEEILALPLDEHGQRRYSDMGVFSFYFHNLVILQPGEAIYIGPNIVHAYLSGDLHEVMAPSDNVIRGGLTPKFIDKDTLVDMLDYDVGSPDILLPNETNIVGYREYPVPLDKYFKVGFFAESTTVNIQTECKPELLFASEGEATLNIGRNSISLKKGQAYLVSAVCNDYSIETGTKSQILRVSIPI